MRATLNDPGAGPMPSLWRMVLIRGLAGFAPVWLVLMLLWSRLQDGSFPSTSQMVGLASSAVLVGIVYGLLSWCLLLRARSRQEQRP